MILTNYYDASDNRDPRTIYSVKLDDGREIDVMRKHFPEWNESRGLWYVMEPHDADIDEKAIIAFVKATVPKEHTMMPVFERKLKGAFAVVSDTCYSIEQAAWLAKQRWFEDPNPDNWELFQIRYGKEILTNFLN